MSTKTGYQADTIGNIEECLQQCLEDMEPDRQRPGRPRFCPRY